MYYVIHLKKYLFLFKLVVKDLKSGSVDFLLYDYVMVCNGHYHTPLYPAIKGSDTFTGQQIHSHDYKNSQRFRGKLEDFYSFLVKKIQLKSFN